MKTVGRYRIDAHVGEGAMADVYRAFDPQVGRQVAIKVLKRDLRGREELVARFLREARAAGMLSHANIATIYDVGEADGFPYIAMEFVDGRPLDSVLQETGRLPIERALPLALQLADALAYAHRNGIVHRDIKPSNIQLCDGGTTAKLLDFGIARIGGSEAALGGVEDARTQFGQVIGTPRYMSPEQALGMPVDHRSDLFSLGAVLYELVTGKTAFAGTNVGTVTIQIAQEQPPAIDRVIRDCPKGLRFIVEKLLAKKPEDRYATGVDVRDALVREIEMLASEEPHRRRGLSLRIKLPLMLGLTTAAALAACVTAVLDRQARTLEHLAMTSGRSITGFVTSNAALYAADNAGLAPELQDWVPLQAFVQTAARDPNVARLQVVDDRGVIRAAADPSLVGRRYAAAGNAGDPLHFVEPIRYAGAEFGKVDLELRRTALDGALANARDLLLVLAAVVTGVALLVGVMSAQAIDRPIRRLRRALEDAAKSNLAFRLSHRRGDEFGVLFDSFNAMAAQLERDGAGGVDRQAPAVDVAETTILNPVHAQQDRLHAAAGGSGRAAA